MLARVLPSTQKPSFRKLSVEPCPRSMSRWPVGGLWWTLLSSPCAKLGVLSTYFPHRIETKFLSLAWKGFAIASHPIFWALQRKVLWESNVRRPSRCPAVCPWASSFPLWGKHPHPRPHLRFLHLVFVWWIKCDENCAYVLVWFGVRSVCLFHTIKFYTSKEVIFSCFSFFPFSSGPFCSC